MYLLIDGSMITQFVSDVHNFHKCVADLFGEFDVDGDGFLSHKDLANGKEENFDDLMFNKFDVDGDGKINGDEFRQLMSEILMAIARAMGPMPEIFNVGKGSLLMKAYEYEFGEIDSRSDNNRKKKEKKEKKKKKISAFEICDSNSDF